VSRWASGSEKNTNPTLSPRPNLGGLGNTSGCWKQCCIEHDKCYEKHGCNASSWKGWKGSACQVCNTTFKSCLYRGPSAECLPSCYSGFDAAP
jgi:hypothetical protein